VQQVLLLGQPVPRPLPLQAGALPRRLVRRCYVAALLWLLWAFLPLLQAPQAEMWRLLWPQLAPPHPHQQTG
jgi:hypothetical protein